MYILHMQYGEIYRQNDFSASTRLSLKQTAFISKLVSIRKLTEVIPIFDFKLTFDYAHDPESKVVR